MLDFTDGSIANDITQPVRVLDPNLTVSSHKAQHLAIPRFFGKRGNITSSLNSLKILHMGECRLIICHDERPRI